MTNNEIIKALECCINDDCDNCPDTFGNCEHNAMRNALDLINRQKEEITKNEKIIAAANNLIDTQKKEIEALIAGQETLQKFIAEKDKEIEQYKARILNDTEYIEKIEVENRKQQAEIERLNTYISRCKSGEEYWVKCLLERPNEAVKEFAERLRFEIINKPSMFKANQGTVDFLNGMTHRQHEILNDLDNLVKEMVGEG